MDSKDHKSKQVVLADQSSDNGLELDGIHDGLVFPTDEEIATLRRVADKIPWGAYRMFISV